MGLRRVLLQWLSWDLQVMPSRYINACTDGIGRLWVSSGTAKQLVKGSQTLAPRQLTGLQLVQLLIDSD